MSVKPLALSLLHRGRRRERVKRMFRKVELSEKAVVLAHSSRSRVKSISRRPAPINRVTIGIIPRVESTTPKKAAVTTGDVFLHSEKSQQPNRRSNNDWKSCKRLHGHCTKRSKLRCAARVFYSLFKCSVRAMLKKVRRSSRFDARLRLTPVAERYEKNVRRWRLVSLGILTSAVSLLRNSRIVFKKKRKKQER